MVACLIQAHPTLTMMEVIDAVRQSASQYSTPDSLLGYGIPNACIADSLLDLLDPNSVIELTNNESFEIYPNPTNNYITITASKRIENVEMLSLEGKLIKQFTFKNSKSVLINCNDLSQGVYIVRVNQSQYKRLVKN